RRFRQAEAPRHDRPRHDSSMVDGSGALAGPPVSPPPVVLPPLVSPPENWPVTVMLPPRLAGKLPCAGPMCSVGSSVTLTSWPSGATQSWVIGVLRKLPVVESFSVLVNWALLSPRVPFNVPSKEKAWVIPVNEPSGLVNVALITTLYGRLYWAPLE